MKLTIILNFNSLKNSILVKVTQSEFGKFIIIGILNTVINYGVFILLLFGLNLVYFIAGAMGFLSGAVSGYFLNRLWTFKSNVPIVTGFLKYIIIQIFCLGAHIITQIGVTEILGVHEVFSQMGGIAITTFMNFFISRAIVFKK